jgi:hypothetical protein
MGQVATKPLHPRSAPGLAPTSRLRLLPKGARSPGSGSRWLRPADERPAGGGAPTQRASERPVLIAGHDARRRAQVHEDMARLMPQGTRFEELGALWEVLERAARSRMVILSGDLDELPPESLLHTLARRYPDLPVVSLDGAPASAT